MWDERHVFEWDELCRFRSDCSHDRMPEWTFASTVPWLGMLLWMLRVEQCSVTRSTSVPGVLRQAVPNTYHAAGYLHGLRTHYNMVEKKFSGPIAPTIVCANRELLVPCRNSVFIIIWLRRSSGSTISMMLWLWMFEDVLVRPFPLYCDYGCFYEWFMWSRTVWHGLY